MGKNSLIILFSQATMKAIKLMLASAMLSGFVFAQTVEFVEPRGVLAAVHPTMTTYKVKDITYVFYEDKSDIMSTPRQLDAYDANMKFAGTSAIGKTDDPEEASTWEGLYAGSDKLILLKSTWDKKTGMEIFGFPVNANAVKGSGTSLAKFPAEKMMNTGNFEANVSPDGTKLVVQCVLPTVKDSLEETMIYVYDNNFKLIWKKDYRFPNANGTEKYRYNHPYVNNAGVVFIMKQVPVHKALDYFTVFTFMSNGSKVEERKMDLGQDGHISTFQTGFCSNGDLIFSGYSYLDKKAGINVETPTSAFMVKVSAVDGGMPVCKITPLANPDADLKANYVLVLADNSAILVGEIEHLTKTLKPGATPNMPGGDSDFDYENGKIMAVKFAADGSKKWDHFIERDAMKSRNDGGKALGIFACMMGDNLVITYQDFIYKHDGKSHMVVGGYDFQRVNVIRKINADGITASESYLTDKRFAGTTAEYQLFPSSGMKMSETGMWFIAGRGLELVSAKVTL
jgi:hypothetical protein